MTWTYTPDFTTARDRIRFLIGDTITEDQLITDEEIVYLETIGGSDVRAAVQGLRQLSRKFARLADADTGDLSVRYSQRSAAFADRANEMEADLLATAGVPFAGGISVSRKETVEADDDNVKPAFKVGMLENPENRVTLPEFEP